MVNFDASLGNYHFRYFLRTSWMLVFYHNITGKVYFNGEEDAMHTLNTSQKYSILSELTPNLKYDGQYEFLLQYGSSKTKFNRWRQDNNPIDEYEEENKIYVDGFEPIRIDYNSTSWPFGGLARGTIPVIVDSGAKRCNNTFLKGGLGDYFWYFAVGQYKGCDTTWEEILTTPNKQEKILHLWVRISPQIYNVYATSCCCERRISMNLFVITLVYSKVTK